MKNLYLIEFYVNDPKTGEPGYEINFAWVYSTDADVAMSKLIRQQGKRFDGVIKCEQHAEVCPLAGQFKVNTPDANLFIIN